MPGVAQKPVSLVLIVRKNISLKRGGRALIGEARYF